MSRYFIDNAIRRDHEHRYSKRSTKAVGGAKTPSPPPRDYHDTGSRDRSYSGGAVERSERKGGGDFEDFENRRRYVSTLLERYYSHPSNRYHSMPSSLRKQLADALAHSGEKGERGILRHANDQRTANGDDTVSDISFVVRSARTTPEPSFYDDDVDGRSLTFNGAEDFARRKRKSRFFRSSSIRSLKKLVSKLRGGGRDSVRSRNSRPATDPGYSSTAGLLTSQDSGLETPSDSSINYNTNNLHGRSRSPETGRAFRHNNQQQIPHSHGSADVPTPALCGIVNHGNTCYINAVVQCLSNTDLLAEYFLAGRYWTDLSNNFRNADRYGSHGNVTVALAQFLNALWFNTYAPDVSLAFKRVVERYSEQYRGNQQQDAQEFFYWLSDHVHEDLNVAVKRRYKLHKSRSKNEDELAMAAMEKHLEAHNSFISARFHGLFLSSVTCPICYQQSTKPDPFMCISLPVSQSTKRPLFVVVVFLNRKPRQIRFGLNADVTATFREVKNCLADAAAVSVDNMVLCEINEEGLQSSLLDQDEVGTLNTKRIWAIETPAVSSRNRDEELVLLVGNQTKGSATAGQWFGAVTALKVHREVSYGDLCRSVLLALRPQLKSTVSVQDISLNAFRMRIVDDYRPMVYVPQDVALPLYTQAVDNALINVGASTIALHLKVMLEWRPEAKASYFSSAVELVSDHVSAQDLRDQEERPEVQSLRDCLAEYTKPESCQWYCPKCRRRQEEANKRILLYWLPDVLVLHLKRFKRQSNGQLVKLDSTVWFPVNDLDLGDFMYQTAAQNHWHARSRPPSTTSYRTPTGELYLDSRQNQNSYDLYAVCNHAGHSPNSGHYTAYCRNPVNGRWYCFDDQTVTAMHERELVTSSAYLLFYERRQSRRNGMSQHSSTESGFVDHWYFRLYSQYERHSYSSKDTLDGLDSNGSSTGSQRKSRPETLVTADGTATTTAADNSNSQNKLYVRLPEKDKLIGGEHRGGNELRTYSRGTINDSSCADAERTKAGDSEERKRLVGERHASDKTAREKIKKNGAVSDLAGDRYGIPRHPRTSDRSTNRLEQKQPSAKTSPYNDEEENPQDPYENFRSIPLPSCAKILTTGIVPPNLAATGASPNILPFLSSSSTIPSFSSSSHNDSGGDARLPLRQSRTCSAVETDL